MQQLLTFQVLSLDIFTVKHETLVQANGNEVFSLPPCRGKLKFITAQDDRMESV